MANGNVAEVAYFQSAVSCLNVADSHKLRSLRKAFGWYGRTPMFKPFKVPLFFFFFFLADGQKK